MTGTPLSARLRELRAGAFRSGSAMARAIGWQQTRVSKIETAAQLPTPDDLDQWVAAVGASAAVRAELGDLLTRARVEYVTFRDHYGTPGGIAERQRQIADAEMQATVLREYQPAMIPGLLQTAAYAREALAAPGSAALVGATEPEIESLVAARIKRQGLLYEQNKTVHVVLGEAALFTRFATTATLFAQLNRLVGLADLPSVDLRVLPFTAESPVMPLAGISIEDERAVTSETLADEQRVTDADVVAAHVKAFDLLQHSALTPSETVALIQRRLAASE